MIKGELLESIEVKDIKDVDFNKPYFHYTDIHNFESILEKGLLPKVGPNSIGVETTENVFFTIGFEQTLILMDVWLRWLIAKSSIELPGKLGIVFYRFCIWLIQWPIKPNFMINGIVKNAQKSGKRREKIYATMKDILDNAIFFQLKLEENIDISSEWSRDGWKNKNFDRKLLELLYNCDCKKNDTKMELWNMHTFTGKVISKGKLVLLKNEKSFKASDIIRFMVNNCKENEKLIYFKEYLDYYDEINSKYS